MSRLHGSLRCAAIAIFVGAICHPVTGNISTISIGSELAHYSECALAEPTLAIREMMENCFGRAFAMLENLTNLQRPAFALAQGGFAPGGRPRLVGGYRIPLPRRPAVATRFATRAEQAHGVVHRVQSMLVEFVMVISPWTDQHGGLRVIVDEVLDLVDESAPPVIDPIETLLALRGPLVRLASDFEKLVPELKRLFPEMPRTSHALQAAMETLTEYVGGKPNRHNTAPDPAAEETDERAPKVTSKAERVRLSPDEWQSMGQLVRDFVSGLREKPIENLTLAECVAAFRPVAERNRVQNQFDIVLMIVRGEREPIDSLGKVLVQMVHAIENEQRRRQLLQQAA